MKMSLDLRVFNWLLRVKQRIRGVYERLYAILHPAFKETELSDNLQNRKNMMENVMKYVPDSKLYYVCDGQDVEADCHSLRDWNHEWIGIGVVIGDYYVCLESHASRNDSGFPYYELGIRKAPGTQISNDKRSIVADLIMDGYERYTGNEWWYYCKDASRLEEKEIIEDIILMRSGLGNIVRSASAKTSAQTPY